MIELGLAANKIVTELLGLKSGEHLVILGDSLADRRMLDITAQAAYAVGAKPIVVMYPANTRSATDPPRPVIEAMKAADAIVEFSVVYAIFTDAIGDMLKSGKVRYLSLTGMDAENAIRTIGKINTMKMQELCIRLAERLTKTNEVRVTSPAGTDITWKYLKEPDLGPLGIGLYQDRDFPIRPGATRVLGGQSGGNPVLGSVNGTLVFDGAIWPPQDLGVLKEPVSLTIKDGRVEKIDGGEEARVFSKWLKSIDDPEMYYIAHLHWGLNPGAKLCGMPLIDERVYGGMEVGLGWYHNGRKSHRPRSKAHSDGVMLAISAWLDGKQIQQDGVFVDPEFSKLEKEMLS